jgi:uncharacterized protein YpuA (DUF1002 family)
LTEKGGESVAEAFGITDPNYARVKAHRLLMKDNIKQEIERVQISLKEALENEGITPSYLAKKVNVLLKATDEKGNTDFTAVDKGLKHATNIYGITDTQPPTQQNNTYNFLFSPEVREEITKMEDSIKARLIKPLNASET